MKTEIKLTEKEMREIGGLPTIFSKETKDTVLKAVEIGQLDMCTSDGDIQDILEFEFGVKLGIHMVKKYLKHLVQINILDMEKVEREFYFTVK